jgi:hypothetical protein
VCSVSFVSTIANVTDVCCICILHELVFAYLCIAQCINGILSIE